MNAAVLFLFLSITSSAYGKSCPGFCTKDLEHCRANNGKIVGYCSDGLACCDTVAGVTGTCGATFKRNNVTYFKSPQFPANSTGDLNCQFNLKLSENSIGIRLDFLQFESDALSYGQNEHTCDSDLFFIRGFQRWMPQARCGRLTGYSTIIPRTGSQVEELKTLTLLALMSSPTYLWNIKITQIYEIGAKSDPESLKSDDEEEVFTQSATGDSEEHIKSNILTHVMNSSANNESWSSKTTADEFSPEFDTERNLNASVGSIINGVETDIKSVPWQASLRMFYTTDQFPLETIQEATGANCSVTEGIHFCGGSIIDNQHVLTAAHCFFGTSKTASMTDLSFAKVVLGDTNKCKDGNTSTYNSSTYDIERVTFHYAYDSVSIGNDVAIVHLKQKIEFKENIKAIGLADTNFELVSGMNTLVSGWGLTELGEAGIARGTPDLLLSNDHFTIENETVCHGFLEEAFGATSEVMQKHGKYEHYFEGVFCTGSKPKSGKVVEGFTGQGDSGGSLVLHRNDTGKDEFVQIGIVSFALPHKSNISSISNEEVQVDAKNAANDPKCNCKADEEVDSVSVSQPNREHV